MVLQDDRFPPAPDVTRRLGTAGVAPLGKPEPPGTPPYYRAASATSSSSNSASSSEYDICYTSPPFVINVLEILILIYIGIYVQGSTQSGGL